MTAPACAGATNPQIAWNPHLRNDDLLGAIDDEVATLVKLALAVLRRVLVHDLLPRQMAEARLEHDRHVTDERTEVARAGLLDDFACTTTPGVLDCVTVAHMVRSVAQAEPAVRVIPVAGLRSGADVPELDCRSDGADSAWLSE